MSAKLSFEHICMQNSGQHTSDGYCFEHSTAFEPKNPENFEEVLVKILAKVETSLLLLQTHSNQVQEFTLIAIPLPPIEENGYNRAKQFLELGEQTLCIEEAWKSMHNVGWDCLQVLALLNSKSIPDNGSRENSLSTFSQCLLESLKAYFLFQKPKQSYAWTEMFDSKQNLAGGFAFSLVWKYEVADEYEERNVSIPQTKRAVRSVYSSTRKRFRVEEPVKVSPSNSKRFCVEEPIRYRKTPFRREIPIDIEEEESESDEDLEITFKDYTPKAKPPSPVIIPKEAYSTSYRRTAGRHRKAIVEEIEMPDDEEIEIGQTNSILNGTPLGFEMNATTSSSRKREARKRMAQAREEWQEDEVDNVKSSTPVIIPKEAFSTRNRRTAGRPRQIEEMESPILEEEMEIGETNSTFNDITLGFEMSTSTPSRKTVVRKSIAPEWPEEEKMLILQLFDNLNPSLSEQKRIALTCRYVVIQYEKELTSKLLYVWIQKKGRVIERTIRTFELNEEEQKTEMISFYNSLNPSQPENTRIAFTLKYFQAQFNINLPSKQLYAWLNDKPVRKLKGRKSMK